MTDRKRLFRAILISQIIWMFTSCHVGNQEGSDSNFSLLAGETHEVLKEKCGGFFEPEYFLFDFNGDGTDDYLVSLVGVGYGGSGGNSVYIFLGGDVLTKVFDGTIRFAYNGKEGGYAPVMVLNEKTDGLYDIAFDGYDAVWQYSEQDGCYQRK